MACRVRPILGVESRKATRCWGVALRKRLSQMPSRPLPATAVTDGCQGLGAQIRAAPPSPFAIPSLRKLPRTPWIGAEQQAAADLMLHPTPLQDEVSPPEGPGRNPPASHRAPGSNAIVGLPGRAGCLETSAMRTCPTRQASATNGRIPAWPGHLQAAVRTLCHRPPPRAILLGSIMRAGRGRRVAVAADPGATRRIPMRALPFPPGPKGERRAFARTGLGRGRRERFCLSRERATIVGVRSRRRLPLWERALDRTRQTRVRELPS
jgi:hypothetical protein